MKGDFKASLVKRFASFRVRQIDTWRRVDGQLLVITPSGYGLREDGIGKLVPISKEDFIVGRDERRMHSLLRSHATSETWRLRELMTVERHQVIGKTKLISTRPIRKRLTNVLLLSGQRPAIPKLFVRYMTPAGNYRYREVL